MGVGSGTVGPGAFGPPAAAGAGLTPGHGISSGSFSSNSISFSPGTGAQVDTTSARFIVLTATPTGAWQITVRLSPDGTTYTTVTSDVGVANEDFCLGLYVPKGWFVEVTSILNLGTVTGIWY